MLLFTIGLFWCIILIAFFFISNNADLSITYPYFLIISFAYWILCFANKFHVNRTIRKWGFRPSYLCFIGLIAVNLQLLADYAFGLAKLPIDFLPEIYKYADICFFSGLIFITVFVLSNYITTDNFRKNRIGQKECLKDKTWLWLYIIAFILFIINIDIVQFLTGQVYIGSGSFNGTIIQCIYGDFSRHIYKTDAYHSSALFYCPIYQINSIHILDYFHMLSLFTSPQRRSRAGNV